MRKPELIASVAEKSELTKKDAELAVNAVLDTIASSLVSGDKVQLIGFGTFEVKERGERKGRNPQTLEEIQIPAAKIPHFKPGKVMRDIVK